MAFATAIRTDSCPVPKYNAMCIVQYTGSAVREPIFASETINIALNCGPSKRSSKFSLLQVRIVKSCTSTLGYGVEVWNIHAFTLMVHLKFHFVMSVFFPCRSIDPKGCGSRKGELVLKWFVLKWFHTYLINGASTKHWLHALLLMSWLFSFCFNSCNIPQFMHEDNFFQLHLVAPACVKRIKKRLIAFPSN